MPDDDTGYITTRTAKEVWAKMVESYANLDPKDWQGHDFSPREYVKENNLWAIDDRTEISRIVDSVLEEDAKKVAAYRSGQDKLFGYFVGQVMKKTNGRAVPEIVNEILECRLKDNSKT